MNKKTVYCLGVDYGADMFDLYFIDEIVRNEMALSYAQEIELANFNLNVAAWMSTYGEATAIELALKSEPWEYANCSVYVWEGELCE